MHTLIVVAHQNLAGSNTQSFLKETAALVPDATWLELGEQPLTVAEITAAQAQVRAADRIVLQFPLYWYSAPAKMWAWLEQVWVRGVVYDDDGGLLTAKTLGLVVNFGHPLRDYRLGGREGLTVDALLAPFAALARKTGLQMLPPLLIAEFARMTEQEHADLLVHYQQYLSLPRPDSQRQQAEWFAEQLSARGADLMADTLTDLQDESTQLHQTVRELRAGEVE